MNNREEVLLTIMLIAGMLWVIVNFINCIKRWIKSNKEDIYEDE